MDLPYRTDDITPGWLQEALAPAFPGLALSEVRLDNEIVGSASKVRLQLEFEEGRSAGCPSSLYIKGGLHGEDQLALSHGAYANEAIFFAEFADKLAGLELPKAYFSRPDRATSQGIVLLEDLVERGVSFGRATTPVTVDQAAATLEWLARMHGRFWHSPQIKGLTAWPGAIEKISEYFLTDGFWTEMTSRPLAHAVPAKMRDTDTVRIALLAMWNKFRDRRETFVHGDSHLGNMYFLADGAPGFLDWQTPMAGPCADDVTYFMIGALTIEDRRANERELLRHYLDVLASQPGVEAAGLDEFWLSYRQQVMHGFMWVATPPQMQPDDIVEANTTRFCAAFEDLETLKALGV